MILKKGDLVTHKRNQVLEMGIVIEIDETQMDTRVYWLGEILVTSISHSWGRRQWYGSSALKKVSK